MNPGVSVNVCEGYITQVSYYSVILLKLEELYWNCKSEINVVCCVDSVQIQIEIEKGWCTVDMESKVHIRGCRHEPG